MGSRNPNPSVCAECKYYRSKRCRMWEVKVPDPEDSHCESGEITDEILANRRREIDDV